jgi:23S rRNA pseudouridine1911/1915/1917 synthase
VYWAVVHGRVQGAETMQRERPKHPTQRAKPGRVVEVDGQRWTRLEMPIQRDPRSRVKMAARAGGRVAETDFRVLRATDQYSLLEVCIGTGRTHQIRVHLSAIGHPVVGDRLYGAPASPAGLPPLERFFLHAREIEFQQPATGEVVHIEAPLPVEFTQLLQALAL